MLTLEQACSVGRPEGCLAVVTTLRADHTLQSSVVNAGMMLHPHSAEQVLVFVTYGRVKLGNLRARPQTAVTFRNGAQWATVEGRAELAGPDDPQPWFQEADLAGLLREVFVAAGGHHHDWNEYDRVMATQRRAAVLIRPHRMYSN
ncbi:TIGR03618 family F420-dependent PPOX class oxidoreductase [Streptomyces sp. NPDC058108]|uniref:TIGR03618 family F420-dependent PPOX class oxidoreductase n=1 Tax=Streptomyces sp. NPDC058108 TaxID=3346344 RepID=UPI0036E00C69